MEISVLGKPINVQYRVNIHYSKRRAVELKYSAAWTYLQNRGVRPVPFIYSCRMESQLHKPIIYVRKSRYRDGTEHDATFSTNSRQSPVLGNFLSERVRPSTHHINPRLIST